MVHTYTILGILLGYGRCAGILWSIHKPYRKAPCSFMVDTWALKGLPYHDFGAYVYTIKLHGAFGISGL